MRWFGKDQRFGISAETRRAAMLGGFLGDPTGTNLGKLRRFVASLDQWPDNARVSPTSGAVLKVTYTEAAPTLMKEAGE